MEGFTETIYFHKDKEDNWDIVVNAKEHGFKSYEDFYYLGYEIKMIVECFSNGDNKVLTINDIDVSDKGITI